MPLKRIGGGGVHLASWSPLGTAVIAATTSTGEKHLHTLNPLILKRELPLSLALLQIVFTLFHFSQKKLYFVNSIHPSTDRYPLFHFSQKNSICQFYSQNC